MKLEVKFRPLITSWKSGAAKANMGFAPLGRLSLHHGEMSSHDS
jgi:hypothetical protein